MNWPSAQEVPAALAGYQIEVLSLCGPHEELAGAATEDTLILRFPSTEAAKDRYDSSSYRKVGEHSFSGAKYRVTLPEGVWMSTLTGKTALITGSSRGIGRATTKALAKQGAHVIVHY
jgi:uncharacterized protein (DUF1330 family)